MDMQLELLTCVRCAACRTVCPTYHTDGREAATPRGRIALMLAQEQGAIALDEEVTRELDLCLGCRACEAACPSGVNYGAILEHKRDRIVQSGPRSWWERAVRTLLFQWLVPSRTRLRFAARLLRFYQVSGLRRLIRASGVFKLMPGLGALEEAQPPVPRIGPPLPSNVAPVGPQRAHVGFVAGCVAGVLLPEVDAATLRVLSANGCRVSVPGGQTCCGALHAHSGELEVARRLARQNIDAFAEVGEVITNSAGCGAMLKEYGELLADDPAYAQKARQFAARVRDVTEYLERTGLKPPPRPLHQTVTFQLPCHLGNVQKVRGEPVTLLRRIEGLQFVPMAETELCCGAAGTYNLVQPETAQKLAARKAERVRETGAQIMATANPGCYLHLRRAMDGVRVVHVVELLDEAYREEQARA